MYLKKRIVQKLIKETNTASKNRLMVKTQVGSNLKKSFVSH